MLSSASIRRSSSSVLCCWLVLAAGAPRVHKAPHVPITLGIEGFINSTANLRDSLIATHGDPCDGQHGRRLGGLLDGGGPVSAAFTNIYAQGRWGGTTHFSPHGLENHGGSGYGSTPSAGHTAGVALLQVIIEFKATHILDAPSGALAWQRDVLVAIHKLYPCVTYHAVDVVPSVVTQNQRTLQAISGAAENRSWAHASQVELSSEPTPTGSDVILCRDALQHLDEPTIRKVLRNFCMSKAPLLLVGGFKTRSTKELNKGGAVGGFMHINLREAPYNFDGPELLQIYHERRPHLEQLQGRTPQVLMLYDVPKLCAKMADQASGVSTSAKASPVRQFSKKKM